MSITSKKIKQKAIELGFHKIGIAKAVETDNEKRNLEMWISQNKNGTMKWMENRQNERGNIFNYFPEAKSVISLGYNYYVGKNQNDLKGKYKFSNYSWGDDYHEVLKIKLFDLLKSIKIVSPHVKGLVCVDSAPIMEKVWAQKAGLGWQGKHTNLISRDYGSWLFLGEIILDIDLETDPAFTDDLCGSCTACIDACPTQALEEYKIDSKKCISYLTIEHREPFKSKEVNLDGWIYGCDVCQEVCPWNIKFSINSDDEHFFPRDQILNFTDKIWENLNEKKFKEIFKKSAVKRTKFSGLSRNIRFNSSKSRK